MGVEDPPDYSPARVIEMRRISDQVLCITLQGPQGFVWTPGQHVAVSASHDGREPSYYSIASGLASDVPGRFDLAVSEAALRVTALLVLGGEVWLSSARGGAPLQLLGAKKLVLVGMGTGVAPLRAIVHAARSTDQHITLIQGARRFSDCLFFGEFQELRSARFEYRPVLSGQNESWEGRLGRVQHHLENVASAEASYCVCGSRAMVDQVREMLVQAGAHPGSVFCEGYS